MRLTNAATYAVAPGAALAVVTRRLLSNSETVALTFMPSGGQRTARSNALTAMRSDIAHARDRAEALAAIAPKPAVPAAASTSESAAS